MTAEANVAELYIATFNRAPGEEGILYWVDQIKNQGALIETVANTFFALPEGQETYPSSLDTEAYVQAIFDHALGRTLDPEVPVEKEGLDFWMQQIDEEFIPREELVLRIVQAATAENATPRDKAYLANKTEVALAFSSEIGLNDRDDSIAVLADVTEDPSTVIAGLAKVYALVSPASIETLVAELYIATFNRAPGEEGLIYWVDQIENQGLSIDTVANIFFAVPEGQETYPSELDTEAYVQAIFGNALGRTLDPEVPADKEGLDFWIQQIDGGIIPRESLVLKIVQAASSETANARDKAYLSNNTDVALAFSMAGLNDRIDSINVLAETTDDPATIIFGITKVYDLVHPSVLPPFVLGVGQDTIVGGSLDDLILATDQTFSTEDIIDGRGGEDALRISSAVSTLSLAGANISGIERLELESTQFSWSNIDLGDIQFDEISIDANGEGTSGVTIHNINSASSVALSDFLAGGESHINFNLDETSSIGNTSIKLSEMDLSQTATRVDVMSEATFTAAREVNTSIDLIDIDERSSVGQPGVYSHTLNTGATEGVAINATINLEDIQFSNVFGFIFVVDQAGDSVNNIEVNLTNTDNVFVNILPDQETSVSDILTFNLSQVENSGGRSVLSANGFETVNVNIAGNSEFQRISTQNENDLGSAGNTQVNINTSASLKVGFWDFSDYVEGSSLINIIGSGDVIIEEINSTNVSSLTINATHATGDITLGEVGNNAVHIATGAGNDTVFAGVNGLVVQTNGGADNITLKNGDDTLVYALATDSQMVLTDTEMTGFDIVTDFSRGSSSDKVLFSSSLSLGSGGDELLIVLQKGDIGGVSAANMQTFIGDGIGFFDDEGEGVRTIAFASDGTDGYLFVDANNDGEFSEVDDMVIQLLGVTEFSITDVQFG